MRHMSAVQTPRPDHVPQVFGQYIGKVFMVCPKCGKGVQSRLNWNTWRVRCRSCHQTIIIGLNVRVPSRRAFKIKYIRPRDTVIMPCVMQGWTSGAPVNVLLSDDEV